MTEELARALRKKSRRRELFGSDRPFVVNWDRLLVRALEAEEEFENADLLDAGIRVGCDRGDLGTVGTCFPTDRELVPSRPKEVGVLGSFHFDSSARAIQAPTLKITVSGEVEGPFPDLRFEQIFLNHGPGRIKEGRLSVPRSWQLDGDGLTPGLLDGLAAAVWPNDPAGLVDSLRTDWRYDPAELSRRVLLPAEREAVLAELADDTHRRARLVLLYAQALSREGAVTECPSVPACDAPPPEATSGGKRSDCDRLRDLACTYWEARRARP